VSAAPPSGSSQRGILLFRGVGGATQLPVAPLREALTEAGFVNDATFINSGNAVLLSHFPKRR
jgi:uncharacterized protein (DUF1697 family)